MATPTKEVLEGKLRELGWNPPADATSAELQKLLKQAKDLPAALSVPERPEPAPTPPPASTAKGAPPLRPPAPLARPVTAPTAAATHMPPSRPITAARPLPVPAVPAPPVPRSDHDSRPHDPFAGW